MTERETVLDSVRRGLQRGASASPVPQPPPIDEPITRLVHSEIGLVELFIRIARENKIYVDPVRPEQLGDQLNVFLRERECARVAVAHAGIVAKLGIVESLRRSGFDVKCWHEMTLDDLYDCDGSITPVDFAVAETGSLVIRGSRSHGRALSLVPPIHVAIVEPKNLLADLVDLFEKLSHDPAPGNTVIITGPSKTADIEMNLVTGVHGPGVVQAFILQ